MYIKMSRTRDVTLPQRAHSGADAGIDFFVPNDFKKVELKPGESVKIPSGVKVEVPANYALIFFNKSGVASKKTLIVGACVLGDTEIATNKGNFKASELTKEFIDQNKIEVLGVDLEDNKAKFSEFDGFRPSNFTDCLKLEFDDGTSIECSNDHKILTQGGWKQADMIDENDEIIKISN